jgi:5'-nucleotidase
MVAGKRIMSESPKSAYRILLTNDDGYRARAFQILAAELQKDYEVVCVAPEQNSSGVSQALTLDRPLFFKQVPEVENPLGLREFYYLSGTPTDCVKFALVNHLTSEVPHLVVSGINKGANLACDVLYSGTVAATLEGFLQGVPGMAISSLDYNLSEERAKEVAIWFSRFLKVNLGYMLKSPSVWNINYPDCSPSEVKGVKVCRLGRTGFSDTYEQRVCPSGRKYFWLTGKIDLSKELPDCDKSHIQNHYITLAPLKTDLTDYEQLQSLKETLSV